ncbi:MAG TPA: DNA-processing protein DprA [Polyangia bacterium]
MSRAAIVLPGPRSVPSAAADFPRSFGDLSTWSPDALWVDGRLPLHDEAMVAIVGSRSASLEACRRVSALAGALAGDGFSIVSGGALGIDAAAHRGALAAHGTTFAVLGCGIDIVYPDRHVGLFREIAATGGLLSEYGPGVQPRKGQFPARNRLVAALARVVIVGECRTRSGALITAKIARRLGRRLCALPGSSGADALLAAGSAWPVSSSADVAAALAGVPIPVATVSEGNERLRRALDGGPTTAEDVAARLGQPLSEVLGLLCEGELDGWILRRAGGRFEVHRGH